MHKFWRNGWQRWWGLLLVISLSLTACSGSDSDSPTSVAPTPTPTPTISNDPGTVVVGIPIRSIGSLKLIGLPMLVGGGSTELLLDTGSAGVRVLSADAGNATRTSTPSIVTFGDGTQFRGVLGNAVVTLGSLATEDAITVQLVDEVVCVDGTSNCSKEIFDGTGFFSGIVGTSLGNRTSNASLFSPIAHLPTPFDSGYVIRTGGFGSGEGTMDLGLTDNNTAGFAVRSIPQVGIFPDGTPSYDDEALQVAHTISNTSIQNSLGNTIFDTGSSDIFLSPQALGSAPFSTTFLPAGSSWRGVLDGGFVYEIQVTTPITPGIDRIFVDGTNDFQVLGMPLFFQFDTFFDIDRGRIGFRAR
ncbi:MAG: hypothetical protein NW237_10325 [Cyanobacteriota bacterium]|nr:hypothetical protein [Cyanobacteriota bacterium]